MRAKVTSTIDKLETDMTSICKRAPSELRGAVSDSIRYGNRIAKGYARQSSGTHARKYPGTFSAQMHGTASALGGARLYSGEYGPRHAGQGELDSILENGSRNSSAHRNLARSQEVSGPYLQRRAGDVVDGLFW